MKKWLITGIAVIVAAFIYAVSTYKGIMDTKVIGKSKAVQLAEEKADLTAVTAVDYYHGKSAYTSVYGKDGNGEKWIVLVPQSQGDTLLYKESDGITKEQAEQIVTNEKHPREIIKVKLGAENEIPLWEVTYIDQENRYAYSYLRFKDGKRDVQYSISQ